MYSQRLSNADGTRRFQCSSSPYHETLTRWHDNQPFVPLRNASYLPVPATRESCLFHAQQAIQPSNHACAVRDLDVSALLVLGMFSEPRSVLVISNTDKDECTALVLLSSLGPMSSLISLRIGHSDKPLFLSSLEQQNDHSFAYKQLAKARMTRLHSLPPEMESINLIVMASRTKLMLSNIKSVKWGVLGLEEGLSSSVTTCWSDDVKNWSACTKRVGVVL